MRNQRRFQSLMYCKRMVIRTQDRQPELVKSFGIRVCSGIRRPIDVIRSCSTSVLRLFSVITPEQLPGQYSKAIVISDDNYNLTSSSCACYVPAFHFQKCASASMDQ